MESESESNLLYHEPCPACGSKDNLGRYDDGHGYCFGCRYYEHGEGQLEKGQKDLEPKNSGADFIRGEYMDLTKRKISEKICKLYKYQVGEKYGTPCHIANFYRDGKLVGQKYRQPGKKFSSEGDIADLWGKQLWTTGKKIVITEGELDCLSVAEAQDGKWPTVSIPNGAQGAKKVIGKNLEWLENNFEEIIFMFDTDEPGIAAAQECAALITPGKARVAQLPAKDANELLMKGNGSEIINAIWRAPVYRPDGIINGKDIAAEICKAYKPADALYPWAGLNEITRGMRRGEIVTLCAGTGIGKSQIMRELAYHIIKENPNTALGYIALEESIKRSAFGLMSIEADRLLHLDGNLKEEELRELHEKVFGAGNIYLYDHWGSLDGDSLMAKIRYLANGCGVEWIVLDHISIMVSGMVVGDERKTIDNLMTNLRKQAEELNVGLLLVSHLKRPEGKAHEEGAQTSLGQLRGSASIGQLSDIVIGVERNQQDTERKNVSILRVLKNRFSGDTGVACELKYSPDTGRMIEEDQLLLDNQDEEEITF